MKPTRSFWIAVFLWTALTVSCCALASRGLATQDRCPDPETVESIGHFEFPPGATSIDCKFIAFQGYTASATFKMPPGDLDAFLNSTVVENLAERAAPTTIDFGYDISHIRQSLYGMDRAEGDGWGYTQYILVDIGNPELFVVYIYVIGGG
jgi:hypothetical protein